MDDWFQDDASDSVLFHGNLAPLSVHNIIHRYRLTARQQRNPAVVIVVVLVGVLLIAAAAVLALQMPPRVRAAVRAPGTSPSSSPSTRPSKPPACLDKFRTYVLSSVFVSRICCSLARNVILVSFFTKSRGRYGFAVLAPRRGFPPDGEHYVLDDCHQ
jgi:hypothetical protein